VTAPGVRPWVDAWQAALSAEQQAAFGYGLLGAHLHGSPQLPLAVSCSDAHETLRDGTAQALAAAGVTPQPPAADYPELYPVTSPAQAAALALRLEQDCAEAWRYLYALAADDPSAQAHAMRASAQAALTASAVRAVRWRRIVTPAAPSVAFPGLSA
jgi:hypothetical protein